MDQGVSAVCKAIQSNKETKLSSLNFGYNGIGPVGANAVAAMVAATGSLTTIDLSDNLLCGGVWDEHGNYTAEGITAIADALRVNGSLTKMRYVTFRSAPSSHILPLTLPTALCNLTTRPLLPSVCVQP